MAYTAINNDNSPLTPPRVETAQVWYRWDGETWAPSTSRCYEGASSSSPLKPTGQLRVMTFNVLADCFPPVVELAIASSRRFAALIPRLEAADADIIGLNEVTPTLYSALLASPFIRDQYNVSHSMDTLLAPHCCVLLSRLPVIRSVFINASDGVPRNKCRDYFPCFVVDVGPRFSGNALALPNDLVAVCALHTHAYQTEEAHAVREAQIRVVTAAVRDVLKSTGSTGQDNNVIVMGDLNLHYIKENGLPAQNQLLDCWAETHFHGEGDQHPGYTFDAAMNAMIRHYIPGETRQMRLDRILCGAGITLRPASPTVLWGTEPIETLPSDRQRSGVGLWSALKSLSLVREATDLSLSDHYGLVQDFVQDGSFTGDAHVADLTRQCWELPLNVDPRTRFDMAWAMVFHAGWLSLRLLKQR